MIKKGLLFVFLCVSSIAVAQVNNYQKGYIITNEQDTVFGWIDFRINIENNTACHFTTDVNLKEKVYYPGEIAGYRFSDNGKYYVSRDITLNGVDKKVFLEYLLQGIMSLYFYDDGEQTYFFFENQDGEMTVVTKKPDAISGGHKESFNDVKYKGYITYIFRDYQPIVEKAKNLSFSQRSFIDLTKKYHEEVCTSGEDCIVFENQKPDKTFMEITLLAYAGINKYDYLFYDLEEGNMEIADSKPAVGIGINLKNPRWSQSWSLQLDIFTSKHDAKYAGKGNGYFSYKANILIVGIGVKYEYPKYKFRPVAEAGRSFLKFNNLKEYGAYAHGRQDLYSDTNYFGAGFDYHLNKKNACIFRVYYTSYGYDAKLGYAYTF
jgi:hypothetical protein